MCKRCGLLTLRAGAGLASLVHRHISRERKRGGKKKKEKIFLRVGFCFVLFFNLEVPFGVTRTGSKQSCFYAGSVRVSKLKYRTTLLFASRNAPVVSHTFLKGNRGKFGS